MSQEQFDNIVAMYKDIQSGGDLTPYEIETLKQEQLDELISTFGIQDLTDQEKIVFLAKECIRLRKLYFEAYDSMKTKIDERVHDKYRGLLYSAKREATKEKNRYIKKLEELARRITKLEEL